jgi:hypothetical protein
LSDKEIASTGYSEIDALQFSFLIFLKLDFNLPSVSRRVSKILPHGGNDNQCGRRGTRTTVLNHTSIVPEAGGNPQCQLPTLPSETDHLVHPSFSRGTNRREPLSDHRLRWGLGSKSNCGETPTRSESQCPPRRPTGEIWTFPQMAHSRRR